MVIRFFKSNVHHLSSLSHINPLTQGPKEFSDTRHSKVTSIIKYSEIQQNAHKERYDIQL